MSTKPSTFRKLYKKNSTFDHFPYKISLNIIRAASQQFLNTSTLQTTRKDKNNLSQNTVIIYSATTKGVEGAV